MKAKIRILVISCFVCSIAIAQNADKYKGTLIEYLTEVNLNIETKFVTQYCNCEDKAGFVKKYQDVAKAFNRTINKHISSLTRLRTRDAIKEFDRISNEKFAKNDASWLKASEKLKLFSDHCSGSEKIALPTAITIAEITGIANSIIGLINEGKKRRDAQRDKLVALLETFKISSVHSYIQTVKCKEEKK